MGARPSRDEVTSARPHLVAAGRFFVIYIKRREREIAINEGMSLGRGRRLRPAVLPLPSPGRASTGP